MVATEAPDSPYGSDSDVNRRSRSRNTSAFLLNLQLPQAKG